MKSRAAVKWIPWLYCVPGILFMTLFVILPILLSAVMSFYSIPAMGSDWVFAGVDNFKAVFRDNEFMNAFGRTIAFGAFGMVTGLLFGLLLSLLVAKHRMLGFYRYVFYLPAVVSAITMGKLWNFMLMPNESGLINIVLGWFGVSEPVNWLGDGSVAFLTVMGVGLVGCGGGMTFVLFTTAINDVSGELLEAANLEGANAFQRSVYVILPIIKPVVSSWALLSIISSFKSFEFVFALNGGGPNSSTTTLAILLYNNSQSNAAGHGSAPAMGILLTLIVMAFTLVYLYLTRDKSEG